MKDIRLEIGNRIKKVRNIRGYSREELANRVSISNEFLYEIENGTKGVTVEILNKICSTLGVSVDYILNGKARMELGKKAMDVLMETGKIDDEQLIYKERNIIDYETRKDKKNE